MKKEHLDAIVDSTLELIKHRPTELARQVPPSDFIYYPTNSRAEGNPVVVVRTIKMWSLFKGTHYSCWVELVGKGIRFDLTPRQSLALVRAVEARLGQEEEVLLRIAANKCKAEKW